MRPERSDRPRLLTEKIDKTTVKYLEWHDVYQGAPRMPNIEPETTLVQRGWLRVLWALPIEQHL